MTSAGDMRESVSFQRRVATTDGFGNDAGTWNALCGPFAARIRPINGKEEILVGKLSGVQPFEITVWNCSAARGVTTEDRAVNARTGVLYDITAIQNTDERGAMLNFLVKTGDAET